MNNNLTRVRQILPDCSRPLVAGDLIPIATALDMLSQYHNRPFSLADIQNIYNEGGHITPVFWYEGKGVIYNPDNVLLNDAYYQQRYDGYISSDTYNDYLKLWLRSPHDITDIHGYFSLDFRNYDGLPFGNLLNLASYIGLPQARLTAKAMLQINRINDHTTYSQAYACFVVPNTQPYNQPVSLTRIKSPLEIGLHDWLIPSKQIERLHPDYKILWAVNDKYYSLGHDRQGKPEPVKHDIAKLDPRFYDVINNLAFAPLAIQSLADTNNTPAKPKTYNLDSLSIGHNGKARERKDLAQKLASDIWEKHDPNQLLRVGDMASLVFDILASKHANLFYLKTDKQGNKKPCPTDQTIKGYLKDIKPSYASDDGYIDIDTQRQITQLTKSIKQLYKTNK